MNVCRTAEAVVQSLRMFACGTSKFLPLKNFVGAILSYSDSEATFFLDASDSEATFFLAPLAAKQVLHLVPPNDRLWRLACGNSAQYVLYVLTYG